MGAGDEDNKKYLVKETCCITNTLCLNILLSVIKSKR